MATALTRLDKTLDAYEKAVAVISAKDAEIGAKDKLIALQKEFVAVKDQIIAAQADLIRFYQKQQSKGKFRQVFEKIEKLLILAGGVYLGGKL